MLGRFDAMYGSSSRAATASLGSTLKQSPPKPRPPRSNRTHAHHARAAALPMAEVAAAAEPTAMGTDIDIDGMWTREEDIPSGVLRRPARPAHANRRRQPTLPKLQLKDLGNDRSFVLDGSVASVLDEAAWAQLDANLEQPPLGLSHHDYCHSLSKPSNLVVADHVADNGRALLTHPAHRGKPSEAAVRVFPSHAPAGRMEAMLLCRTLATMLRRFQAALAFYVDGLLLDHTRWVSLSIARSKADLVDRSRLSDYTRDEFYRCIAKESQLYDTIFEEAARQVIIILHHYIIQLLYSRRMAARSVCTASSAATCSSGCD